MSTTLDVELELMPVLDDGGPVHYLCCEDQHLAYCGKTLSGDKLEPPDTPVTCADCIVCDEMHFCPKHGLCPHA